MTISYVQGHVRVGADLVTDPAYLVTRTMEDYVTWVDTSKIKKHIMKYNDKLDDFDLLGEQQLYFVISFVCCNFIDFELLQDSPKSVWVVYPIKESALKWVLGRLRGDGVTPFSTFSNKGYCRELMYIITRF